MTEGSNERLPEPTPGQQYEQEWLEPQVQTYDVAGLVSKAIVTVAVITGVFGAIMLIWPGATVRVVAILFGLWLILSGIGMLVQALASQGNGFLRLLLGLGGLLSLIIGGVSVVNSDASVTILVLFVVIGWLANGLAYLIAGIRNKYSPARSFYLFFGILQARARGVRDRLAQRHGDRARAGHRCRPVDHSVSGSVGRSAGSARVPLVRATSW